MDSMAMFNLFNNKLKKEKECSNSAGDLKLQTTTCVRESRPSSNNNQPIRIELFIGFTDARTLKILEAELARACLIRW